MKRQSKHLYAVIRVDKDYSESEPWESRISVKEVVLTPEEAEKEVERLNQLNGLKNDYYFWQTTRLVER